MVHKALQNYFAMVSSCRRVGAVLFNSRAVGRFNLVARRSLGLLIPVSAEGGAFVGWLKPALSMCYYR